jgi:rubrerythrin
MSEDLLREATKRFGRSAAPAGLLQGLHGLKLSAGRAYEAASLVAPDSQREMYATLADHERKHAKAVATMLGALAAKRPRRPTDDDVAALAGGIGDAKTPHAALVAAQRLEAGEISAFEAAMARMDIPKLLQTFLTIAAADGQHRAAIRLALGEEPVPKPFA